MRALLILLVSATFTAGQTAKPNNSEKPLTVKAPETPQELAARLLESAHDAVGKAQPGAQAALLWRIGDNYVVFDKKKALVMLEQAFSVAGATPGGVDGQLETFIAKSVSDLDLKRAAEMVRAMPPDSRNNAINAVVRKLADKEEIDEAMELVNLGAGSHYPFDAVETIFKALKDEDDPRRAILFGNAITGYQANPDRAFGELVAANWEHLPRASVLQALDAIVTKVATYKEDATIFKISIVGAKGSADLNTEQEIELFDVRVPLEALEPGKLEELYTKYPGLKTARDAFPDAASMKGTAMSMSGVSGRSASQKATDTQHESQFNTSMTLSQQAEALAPDDLAKAMDKIASIPLPGYRATAMLGIAEQRIESDSTVSKDLLSKALAILAKSDITAGGGVVQDLTRAAADAHKLRDDALTRKTLELALDAAGKLLKADIDPDDPNTAPEDMWPSTHNYRAIIRAAAEYYGTGATSFLEKIPNVDMYLYAQVALAAGLLHRKQSEMWMGHLSKKASS